MAVPQFDLCFDPSGGENLYEPTEPVAKNPRFGDKSSEEVDALIEERVPISTPDDSHMGESVCGFLRVFRDSRRS